MRRYRPPKQGRSAVGGRPRSGLLPTRQYLYELCTPPENGNTGIAQVADVLATAPFQAASPKPECLPFAGPIRPPNSLNESFAPDEERSDPPQSNLGNAQFRRVA